MNTALWIVSGVLAAAYLASGVMKLATPYDRLLKNPKMAWAEGFSPRIVQAIGAAEGLGAAGLLLPRVIGVAEILAPLAAAGLVLLQVGAITTHVQRREFQPLPINITLTLLAGFVAIGLATRG
ncbi:DoxX family protein [Nocardia sp. NPDC052566]|uniref:DoxX family protein n=1 Tax=Nocardia sp. NPDC052566 TaxID=3364330 RepID=UPI0037CB1C60